MVGPLSDEQRESGTRRLQMAFVALVAASAGMISLQVDPTIVQFAVAVLGGVVLGVVLVAYLFSM